MATTADIRNGMILKLDNALYSVVEFGQNKTARAAAKVWAKLKGVDNNRSIEYTWNSGDNIYPVRVERRPYQFLYKDDSGYNFMDTNTFDQIVVGETMIDRPELFKVAKQAGFTQEAVDKLKTVNPLSRRLSSGAYSWPTMGDTACSTPDRPTKELT